MRPVGVPKPRRGQSQAQLVALWLGTFELIKAEATQSGHLLSNDAIAGAATALVSLIDTDQPWIGHFMPALSVSADADTLDETGSDPERHIIGEDAIAELRDHVVRGVGALTGDTQVARMRPMLLLMIASAAVALAPIRVRVPGVIALILAAADVSRRVR